MAYYGELLIHNAKYHPDRTAVISGERSLSYKELNDAANRLAAAFARLGIKKGDRLAMLVKSGVDWLVIWQACHKLGVCVVLIHSRLLVGELVRTIRAAEADVLVYSGDYADKAVDITENCPDIRFVIGCVGGCANDLASLPEHYELESLMSAESAGERQQELEGDCPAVILFTSGTTGLSKGVVRSQQMMYDYARTLAADNFNGGKSDVLLTSAPLYHAAGLCCVVKMGALAGTVALLNKFIPENICRCIQTHRVTQLALVPPTTYQRLRQSPVVAEYDLSSVELVHLTAGKTTRECYEDICALFPNTAFRSSWGSTETSNVTCAILSRQQLRERPELLRTVGRINSVAEIKLVNEQGETVPDGCDGEAYVRSPLVFSSYLDAPELCREAFSNGWFRTEDIMRRDAEGYYYLMDRKRDMVKTGGENVYVQEVERVIVRHPAVSACAVIGVPDPQLGEAIAAALVLKPGAQIEAGEFVAFVKRFLPSYKKPRYWAILDRLPENDIGKVMKTTLRHQAAELFTKIS